jgi:hypothetical protein
MRRENDLRIGQRLDRLKQLFRRLGKTGQRVRIQHQPPLRGQRGQHEIAGAKANAGARPDHQRVEALVGQQLGKLDRRIYGANHHRCKRGSIDRQRVPGRGQRDQAGAGPERAARRHPRSPSRSQIARDHERMAA